MAMGVGRAGGLPPAAGLPVVDAPAPPARGASGVECRADPGGPSAAVVLATTDTAVAVRGRARRARRGGGPATGIRTGPLRLLGHLAGHRPVRLDVLHRRD